MVKNKFIYAYVLIVIIVFLFPRITQAQTWEQMENDYENLLNESQNDLALNKAKELKQFALRNEGDTSLKYAVSLRYIGNCFRFNNNNDSAIFYLEKSLSTLKNQNRYYSLEASFCLNNLGIILSDRSEYIKAIDFYLESLKLKTQILGAGHDDCLSILNNIAIVYSETGNYEAAENYYLKVLEGKKINESKPDYASILNNLGSHYSDIGNYDLALKYYMESINIRKRYLNINHPDYISSLNNIGKFYLVNSNYKLAEKYFRLGLSLIKKEDGYNQKNLNSLLTNLGYLNLEIGNYKDARIYFSKAIDLAKNIFGELSMHNLHCMHGLGNLFFTTGNYKMAIKILKKTMKIEKSIFHESHFYYTSTLNNLGYAYLEMGKFINAKDYFNELINISSNLLIKNFSWLNVIGKESYWERSKFIYDNLNRFGIMSYSSFPSFTNFSYKANLIKKSLLLENSRQLDKAITESNDDSLIFQFSEMKTLRRLYSKMQSEGSDKEELMDRYNKQADSLDMILVNKVGEYAALKRNFELSWEDVQEGVSVDEAAIELVDYYDSNDSSNHYMALLVKKGIKYPLLIKLCKEEELKHYSPESELNDLYDLVWKPLRPYLEGIKTVYYSPSGLLNNIPFQALYKEVNGQREYVMDNFKLHLLTSTRYLALDLKKKEQEPIDNSIALFGGINYNDYPNAVIDTSTINESSEAAFLYKNAITLNRDLNSTRAGVSYLPGTKTEVNTIAQLLKNNNWSVDMADGKNASEKKIKSYSGNNSKSILHIATHGFAYPVKEEKKQDMALRMIQGNERYRVADNPMIRSGLLFGGANLTWKGKGDSLLNKTNEDGVLTAYELSQLDLSNTKLAVLSACETGKGAIQGSEGIFGLKRALKLAGVDNIIVSLWKVSDDATMEMMTLFYNELSKTKKPVSSFEIAQKAMRLKYPTEPKKWAGFVFVR